MPSPLGASYSNTHVTHVTCIFLHFFVLHLPLSLSVDLPVRALTPEINCCLTQLIVGTVKTVLLHLLQKILHSNGTDTCCGCQVDAPQLLEHDCLHNRAQYYLLQYFEEVKKRLYPMIYTDHPTDPSLENTPRF